MIILIISTIIYNKKFKLQSPGYLLLVSLFRQKEFFLSRTKRIFMYWVLSVSLRHGYEQNI